MESDKRRELQRESNRYTGGLRQTETEKEAGQEWGREREREKERGELGEIEIRVGGLGIGMMDQDCSNRKLPTFC